MSASFCSPAVDGGGIGAGGGTTLPLSCCWRVVCCSAGRSSSMNSSVGRVRQEPSATWSSTQACTSAPVTTPPSGTTAPKTTRAGTPMRLASRAIQAAYCSSLPTRNGEFTPPVSSVEPVAVVAGVVDLLALDDAVGVLALGLEVTGDREDAAHRLPLALGPLHRLGVEEAGRVGGLADVAGRRGLGRQLVGRADGREGVDVAGPHAGRYDGRGGGQVVAERLREPLAVAGSELEGLQRPDGGQPDPAPAGPDGHPRVDRSSPRRGCR